MENIHQKNPNEDITTLDCTNPNCSYHVYYDPNDIIPSHRISAGIITVYLTCDNPNEPHTNKYKIK